MSTGWDVLLRGRPIDTVFYDNDCTPEYVLRSLINHDGFNHDIVIQDGHACYRFERGEAVRCDEEGYDL